MDEIKYVKTNSNERKSVELLVYFYLFKDGKSVSTIDESEYTYIIVQEHIFVEQLIDEAFTDTTTSKTINIPQNDFLDEIPYGVFNVSLNDGLDALDTLLSEFIGRFSKGNSGNINIAFKGTNEFPAYNLSQTTIESILERFSSLELDFGNMKESINLPVKNFNNDSIIIKNAKLIVEQCELHGGKHLELDTVELFPKDQTLSNYLTLSSNTTIDVKNIIIHDLLFLRGTVKTEDDVQFNNSSISLYNTLIVSDDESIPDGMKVPLIRLLGARNINCNRVRLIGDIPGYRIIDISRCETFEIIDYERTRVKLASTQDIIVSDFFEGTFLDCVINGPIEKQQEPSMYFVFLSKLRSESKVTFNNVIVDHYGLVIATGNMFNTLKCMNSNISNCDIAIDFKDASIEHVILKSITLKNINSFNIVGKQQSIIDSELVINEVFNSLVRDKFNISSTSIRSKEFSILARENSKINVSDTQITTTENISIKGKRPPENQKTEVFSFKDTILSTNNLIFEDVLKINCKNLVLEKVRNSIFANTILIFSSVIFDYMNTICNIEFIDSKFTGSVIEYQNVPNVHKTNITNSTGKIVYNYTNENDSKTTHNVNLIKSPLYITIEECYGIKTVNIKSEESSGLKVLSLTEEATVIPDISSADKLLFKKITDINETSLDHVLYGKFV